MKKEAEILVAADKKKKEKEEDAIKAAIKDKYKAAND